MPCSTKQRDATAFPYLAASSNYPCSRDCRIRHGITVSAGLGSMSAKLTIIASTVTSGYALLELADDGSYKLLTSLDVGRYLWICARQGFADVCFVRIGQRALLRNIRFFFTSSASWVVKGGR